MKGRLFAFALAVFSSVYAHAATKITDVTNDFTATNGCTVRSAAGYGGYEFQVTVYGVDCPNDPEVYPEKVEHFTSWGAYWCEMRTYSSGYFVTGSCGDYSIYRN